MKHNLQEGMRWLSQARFDLKATQWLLQGRFWWEVCFKSQQTSEKALKAYLYARGKRPVLGHALLALGKECAQWDTDFEKLEPGYRHLDRYYITTRYPNGLPGSIPAEYFEEDEAQEALALAEQIVTLVETKFQVFRSQENEQDAPEASE
ncbi:MAG: HEPN domain-containing protein [Anaerolineae bacterium]|nr:HEPN domain-containing protein [Anaerolineae bacterium]